MKKILCLFDHYARTGYGIVSEQMIAHLLNHFGKEYSYHIVATNYFGEPTTTVIDDQVIVYVESGKLSQNLERTPENLEQDAFGRMVFLERLRDMDFDGIFIMQDLGIIQPMIEHLAFIKDFKRKANRKQFKSIFYFPVDGDISAKHYKNLEFFDLLVTYTEYGKKQALSANPKVKGKIKIVPHGTSKSDYHVLPSKEVLDFRASYFNDADKELFIIGAINRNQPRKDIPASIFGFLEAKNNWTMSRRPFLYLHMNPTDPNGWLLKDILDQCELVEGVDYMFPKTDDPNYQVDTKTMNLIYNSIDVYLSTSRGEGWGLVTTEIMACGKLCILPNHTSYTEIGQNRALFVEYYFKTCTIDDNVIRDTCDYVDVGSKIIDAYHLIQENGASKMIENALQFTQNLRWADVCKHWFTHFKETY